MIRAALWIAKTCTSASTDAQGKLIGATSTTISPTGESIAAGSTESFSAYVSLAPSVDLSTLTYKITVIGVMH